MDYNLTTGETSLSGKIKSISFSKDDKKVNLIFDNLDANSEYEYSIYYKYPSQDEYSITYNDDNKINNEKISISALKMLDISENSVSYETKYWGWDSIEKNVTDFIKQIKINFSVDTSKYELSDDEIIKFDVVAKKQDSEINIISEQVLMTNKVEVSGFNKNLDGNYKIILIPKLFKGDTERSLDEKTLGDIEISKNEPKITIENNKASLFRISMDDKNGVLESCEIDNPDLTFEKENYPTQYIAFDGAKEYYE